MKILLLFDVDGTLCESGKTISHPMSKLMDKLSGQSIHELDIGIVGGGTHDKIITQLDNQLQTQPKFIFSECGSVYKKHDSTTNTYQTIKTNNLTTHPEYTAMNKLIRTCLKFISETDYELSGNFIDMRNGLFYISLVGMSATNSQRQQFTRLDDVYNYRMRLLNVLKTQTKELGVDTKIDVCLGGSVGIAIYPTEWNKVQVLELLEETNCFYDEIHFFGDKYLSDGNDHKLMIHPDIIPHCVDSLEDTVEHLEDLIFKYCF